MRVHLILIMLMSFGLALKSHAEVSLQSSRIWQRARVIASGQQVWGLKTTYSESSERFGANGLVEPLGQAYGRALTWKQILNADPQSRVEMQDFMRQHSVRESDVAAAAVYQVDRQETGLMADWAYGLTSRWMIGFQVPVVFRRTRVTGDVELTPMLEEGVKTAGVLRGLPTKTIRTKVLAAANQQLLASGYSGVPEQKNSWDWGDISLINQFELVDAYAWTWSVQPLVRLPTAQKPRASDFIQTNEDNGQVDVGLTSLVDYRHRRWTAGWRLGYVAQLPDSIRMHVPQSDVNAVDPSVHRDLGDYGWASVDVENRITRRFSANVEHTYMRKAADRYQGQSTLGMDYASLGQDTAQELHHSRASLQYRLGEASTRSGVENKWVASVAYAYPWIGRNSSDASQASLELISYF